MHKVLGLLIAALILISTIPAQARTPKEVREAVNKMIYKRDHLHPLSRSELRNVDVSFEGANQEDVVISYHPHFTNCDLFVWDLRSDGTVDKTEVTCNDPDDESAAFKIYGGPQEFYERILFRGF